MHVAGLEQLLRRFPLRLGALRGNRLMRVLLNRGGGHVDTFGQGILAQGRKVLGNRHKLAAVRNEAIKNFRQGFYGLLMRIVEQATICLSLYSSS